MDKPDKFLYTLTVNAVAQLVARSTLREPVSGARLETLVIDGAPYVLERISIESDVDVRPWQLWRSGVLDRLPACLEHAVVAMDVADGTLSILMHDVRRWLMPPGHTPVAAHLHHRFLDHLAAMHARFWDWEADHPWLVDLDERYRAFAPPIAGEPAVAQGWALLPRRAPELARIVRPFLDDAGPLVAAMGDVPLTLVHGDPKLSNLGAGEDGRTILLDWAAVGQGPACVDLAHYLALNRARLPFPKEDAIAAYRRSLEGHGVATEGWWGRQVSLCLLGVMVMFGWEKALGDAAELAWWEDRACEAERYLR